MQIISISGLDGSGKSTQINLLKESLEKQGKKVYYFHAVQFSTPQALNNLLLKIFGSSRVENDVEKAAFEVVVSKKQSSVIKANWLQIQLRKIALSIDLIRFKSFKSNLEKQGYDYLLSDRYFYDSIINIAYLESRLSTFDFRLSTKMIPRPDFAFYLNTDPENIMSRDRVPDQGLEYLQKKKVLLDEFSKENNLIVIDGNRDKQEIFENIKSIVISNQ